MPPFNEDQQIYRRAILQDRCNNLKQQQQTELSRTQHKLQLQRLSFLTNDKNYLDHPQNMKRLTKELDRVNREYRNVRRYEDPVKESFKRLVASKCNSHPAANIPSQSTLSQQQQQQRLVRSNSSGSSNSSKISSSSSLSSSSTTTTTSCSASPERSSFLSRWFVGHDDTAATTTATFTTSTLPVLTHNNQIASATEQCNSVVYSFHPTIASQMKRKNKI